MRSGPDKLDIELVQVQQPARHLAIVFDSLPGLGQLLAEQLHQALVVGALNHDDVIAVGGGLDEDLKKKISKPLTKGVTNYLSISQLLKPA